MSKIKVRETFYDEKAAKRGAEPDMLGLPAAMQAKGGREAAQLFKISPQSQTVGTEIQF